MDQAQTERFIDLEMRLAHLERVLETYDDLLIKQQNDIDHLQKINNELLNFADSAKPYIIKSQEEETPPPHY